MFAKIKKWWALQTKPQYKLSRGADGYYSCYRWKPGLGYWRYISGSITRDKCKAKRFYNILVANDSIEEVIESTL